MKTPRWFFIIAMLLTFKLSEAKKVKFTVDMTGQTVSSFGVHIVGDFQTLAGYTGGDWVPNTTEMKRADTTSPIYSVVVEIPAFRKYEYRFINGNQLYETEFVPEASRVGYNFNDNRWLYVDSLTNDTTDAGPIVFSGNAPAGKKLMRFKVEIPGNISIHTKGIHVSGFGGQMDPKYGAMYTFGDRVYEIISYHDSGNFLNYRYYNGLLLSEAETVPQACNVFDNREIQMLKDTVMPSVCFGSCEACVRTGLRSASLPAFSPYPNPAHQGFYLPCALSCENDLEIFQINGQPIYRQPCAKGSSMYINTISWAPGLYILKHHGFYTKIWVVHE